jgi:CheY-like chemotaxis protein
MAGEKTVLVVDDDQRIVNLLQETLEASGYQTVAALGGPEAMRQLTAHTVDAVITDIKMPGWDGITLLERIKESWPELPVIMITAYADQDIRQRAKTGGASGFLAKPFRIGDLQATLGEAISAAKSQSGQPQRLIEKILVVEDDEEFREILMEVLPEMGYKPVGVSTAEEAIRSIKEHPVDVVLCDYLLPTMSGADLLHEVKAMNPETLVVMITGYPPSLDGHTFTSADGYLMKPFRFDEIEKMLSDLSL